MKHKIGLRPDKLSMWRIADRPEPLCTRPGAWEIVFPDGDGGVNTITVSGPNAKMIAEMIRNALQDND